jgi:hypothetical protein
MYTNMGELFQTTRLFRYIVVYRSRFVDFFDCSVSHVSVVEIPQRCVEDFHVFHTFPVVLRLGSNCLEEF